jgi:hypothetical protein
MDEQNIANIAKVLLSLRKLIIIRNVFYNTKTDRLYNIQDLSPSELCDVIEIMSMSRYQFGDIDEKIIISDIIIIVKYINQIHSHFKLNHISIKVLINDGIIRNILTLY